MTDIIPTTTELSAQPTISPEMFAADPLNVSLQDIENCLSYAKENNVIITARNQYPLDSTITFDSVKWFGGEFFGNGDIVLINSTLQNADINGPCIAISGGACEILNNKLHNQASTSKPSALFIGQLTSTTQLTCLNNEFYNSTYSILHQGGGSAIQSYYLTSGIIAHNTFHDNTGDAIELNLVNRHYSNGLIIEGNIISNINDTKSGSNWGIGIGVAGYGPYDIDQTEDQFAANFTIKDNHISGCRHGIHTEMCRDFNVINNTCFPDNTKSVSTGIICAAFAAYGCKRFQVNGFNGEPPVDQDRFIVIDWGNNDGDYAAPPRDFTVKNINTLNGKIEISTAGSDNWSNTTILENIRCGQIYWRGLPSISVFRNIYCKSIDCIGRHSSGEGSGGGIYSRASFTYTHWVDVLCLNEDAQTNTSITKMKVDKLISIGNNFPVLMATPDITGHRGPLLISTIEQYLLPDDNFPTGRDFSEGTILWKRSGGYFIVTSPGAKITGNDIVSPLDKGDATLHTANYDWTGEQHLKNAGTPLLISGAGETASGDSTGADLIATITKGTYVSNGKYSIDITPPIQTSVGTTILRAARDVQYVEIS